MNENIVRLHEANQRSAHLDAVTLDDFVAFMPAHYYIFTPCREPWPAASVNAKLGKVTVTDADGDAKEFAPAPGSTGTARSSR